ncbi:MAG: corrinoid protein [archaeon YNP-WB-062]|jgi:corrinoid protein of di/trimethylamine methyltransferase|nr:corrinoid protein [Candidatus Culexarchaeum yellowstonense]
MHSEKEGLLSKLKEAAINGDSDQVVKLSKRVIEVGIDPLEAVEKALIAGVLELGDKWINGEVFIVDMIAAAEAMKAGLSILKNEIVKRGGSIKYRGRIVIGTVEGDIHDIGKSIVASLLEAAGFEVIDLGVDVSAQKFIEAIKQYNPDIVGMSALMTTTMLKQREIIEAIKQANLRGKVKIIVGGAPTTKEWAEEIGADGWAPDAASAVELVKKLLK